MKIISIRNGFASDHSSTSYEFAAVDKPLGKEARRAVAGLSSRARPTPRTVSFVYNVDGYDIPGGWEALMRDYYDVMYSESYDWWLLAIAFNASPERQAELQQYDFRGKEDLGIDIACYGERVVMAIHCRLKGDYLGSDDDWDFMEDDDAETADEVDGETDRTDYEPNDPLLALLTRIRHQLMAGDYRALYAVWEEYGQALVEDVDAEDEDEWLTAPPEPAWRKAGAAVVDKFREMLDLP